MQYREEGYSDERVNKAERYRIKTRTKLVSFPHPWTQRSNICDRHDNTSFCKAMHQLLSHAAIVGYSVVSHDNHMQATWCESDGVSI